MARRLLSPAQPLANRLAPRELLDLARELAALPGEWALPLLLDHEASVRQPAGDQLGRPLGMAGVGFVAAADDERRKLELGQSGEAAVGDRARHLPQGVGQRLEVLVHSHALA